MHDYALVERSFQLKADGYSDLRIAAELGVSIGSVRRWRYGTRRGNGAPVAKCPRCEGAPLDRQKYAYLLGLYLGDGCLNTGAAMREKGVYVLSIACSNTWPGLMDECEAAVQAVMPHNSVHRVARAGMHEVKAYSKHWPCLFPQHGPGRKHERAIVLEGWQREVVEEFAEEFIRGLIHSDGCRVLNSAVRTREGRTTRYYYPRYHFANESADILRLFTWALDLIGVDWRYNRVNSVSVAKRDAVRRLDGFVGPKR